MEMGAARLGRVAGLCGVGGRGQVGVRWLQDVEISESGVGGGCEVEARERAISGEEVGLTRVVKESWEWRVAEEVGVWGHLGERPLYGGGT